MAEEFTACAPFEWEDAPPSTRFTKGNGTFFNLRFAGLRVGHVYRAVLDPQPGAEWVHDYGVAATAEEAKHDLLAALGVAREDSNAYLIAALEHADETLERLHAYRDRHDVWDVNMDLCWDDVRAALAKARGEVAE